jgi:hypothetical protein
MLQQIEIITFIDFILVQNNILNFGMSIPELVVVTIFTFIYTGLVIGEERKKKESNENNKGSFIPFFGRLKKKKNK